MNHGSNDTQAVKLTGEEIAKHNSREDCWVIVNGRAYDVTEFLPEHPGGAKIILKYAGKDATEEYAPIHPPDTLDKYLDKSRHLGEVDMGTVQQENKKEDPEEAARQQRIADMPILEQCYNLVDFEAVAKRVMKKTAWAYYSSGADDEIVSTPTQSRTAQCDQSLQTILTTPSDAAGKPLRLPQDLVPAADPRGRREHRHLDHHAGHQGRHPLLRHRHRPGQAGQPGGRGDPDARREEAQRHPDDPDAGLLLLRRDRGCCRGRPGAVAAAICKSPSPSPHPPSSTYTIRPAKPPLTPLPHHQVNKNRAITKKIIEHAEARGCKGLFITVDAPQLGRREKDMRSKFDDVGSNVQSTGGHDVDRSQGAARAISSFIDPSLSWKDIPWFLSVTKMPVLLKGVQRVEDVIKAIEAGVHGVVLSNHGGRQLDFARSGVEVLAEVMPVLRSMNLQDKIEIYIDGGVRRATDIIKALCLGAKGVGIGRPFLYAMSAYGLPGVDRAMQLLKDEMVMNMRLIGCSKIEDLNPSLIDTRGLGMHTAPVPGDTLSLDAYDPLIGPKWRDSETRMSKL